MTRGRSSKVHKSARPAGAVILNKKVKRGRTRKFYQALEKESAKARKHPESLIPLDARKEIKVALRRLNNKADKEISEEDLPKLAGSGAKHASL